MAVVPKTEKCPGCGMAIVLRLGKGSGQPVAFDLNGAEHVCSADSPTTVPPEIRPIGQMVNGSKITGFEVRNRKLSIVLEGGRVLNVFAGGKPLRIWMVGPEGIVEDA